jgi:hypothetical protein
MSTNGLTIIESPYAGELERNRQYLARAIRHSVALGEVPFASHGFFTWVFNDLDPASRKLGIQLGYYFWPHAERVVFYVDYGMSNGMEAARHRLEKHFKDMKTAYRRIGKND